MVKYKEAPDDKHTAAELQKLIGDAADDESCCLTLNVQPHAVPAQVRRADVASVLGDDELDVPAAEVPLPYEEPAVVPVGDAIDVAIVEADANAAVVWPKLCMVNLSKLKGSVLMWSTIILRG